LIRQADDDSTQIYNQLLDLGELCSDQVTKHCSFATAMFLQRVERPFERIDYGGLGGFGIDARLDEDAWPPQQIQRLHSGGIRHITPQVGKSREQMHRADGRFRVALSLLQQRRATCCPRA
jgi:hypothetical protein